MEMKITGLDLLNKLRFSKVSSVTGIYETEDVTIHGEKIHVLKFIDSDGFEIKKEPVAADSEN
jgi:hypothetical protein